MYRQEMPRILLTALAVVALTACAGVSADTTTTSAVVSTSDVANQTTTTSVAADTTTTEPEFLPPHLDADVVALFDPIVQPYGFRVTRGSLVDLASYQASPDGRHLAVYVAPLSDFTPDEHAEAFVTLARIFLPSVFERWSGLESFDICQEPHLWPEGQPPAVTLFDIDRDSAEEIDWDTVTLGELIDLSEDHPHVRVIANADVAASAPWREAIES